VVYHLENDTEDTLATPPQPPPTTATAAATTNRNKHTNNDVTKYTQSLPEDTTSTVPSVADKQKTVTQYISQEEKSEILKTVDENVDPHTILFM